MTFPVTVNAFFFYASLNFFLFLIGFMGIIYNRHQLLSLLISVEIILLSIILNFILYTRLLDVMEGELFTLLLLTVSAAELTIGLAIIVITFRLQHFNKPDSLSN